MRCAKAATTARLFDSLRESLYCDICGALILEYVQKAGDMKAIANTSMILGAIVLAVGVLALNIVLVLIGCIGLLAGSGVNRQLTYDERLARIESQLRIILQTQRQTNQLSTQSVKPSPIRGSDEDIAFDFLRDE